MAIDDLLAQQGPIREVTIGAGLIIFAFSIYFGIQFIYEALKRRKQKQSSTLYISWIVFFFLLAIRELFLLIVDFYPSAYLVFGSRLAMQKIGLFFTIASILSFSIPVEQLAQKMHYIYSVSLVSIYIITVSLELNLDFVSLLIALICIVILAIFYFVVTSRVEEEAHLQHKVYFVLIGLSIMFFRNALSSDFLLEFFGMNYRLVGGFITIFALFLLQFSFSFFPSLLELEWKKHLKSIYIISSNGLNIYSRQFNEGKQKLNAENKDTESEFIAAAFSGIISIISEITGTLGKLSTIDQGDMQLIIAGDNRIKLFLVATENVEILHVKLDRLYNEIIELYGEILSSWGGNVSIFQPIEQMVTKIFGN